MLIFGLVKLWYGNLESFVVKDIHIAVYLFFWYFVQVDIYFGDS
jgi:hypothetical protein